MWVLVGGVQVQVVVAVGHVRAVRADRHGVAVPLADALLPASTPAGRALGQRHGANGLAIHGADAPVSATDKA